MSALHDQAQAAGDNAEGLPPVRCRFCEEPIPEGRRLAVPGVETCVDCQSDIERRATFDWGMAE